LACGESDVPAEVPADAEQQDWEELRPSGTGAAWAASAKLLIKSAKEYLDREPEIAWRCHKVAARMMLQKWVILGERRSGFEPDAKRPRPAS
jgi:hypothetical protein